MKARISSTLSRWFSPIRHWLRYTWLSHLSLLERPQAWLARLPRSRAARRWRPTQVYPTLETLEPRWTPDDLWGTVQAPLMVGGLVLMPVSVVTPAGVLVKGWPNGVAPPDLRAANADLRLAQGDDRNRLADEDVTSLFAAWSQASLQADSSQANGAQPEANDPVPSRAASGGDGDWKFSTAAQTEDGLREGLDSLAGPKPASRWHPPSSSNSSSPNAHADSGGSGPGGKSTANGGGGGSGGGGGGMSLNVPNQAALSQMQPNGNPVFASPAGTIGGTASPQSQPMPAVTSTGTNVLRAASTDPTTVNVAAFSTLAQNYGNTPLGYTPNVGQTDPTVNFMAQGAGFGLFLTPTGATFDMPVSSPTTPATQTPPTSAQPIPPQFDAFSMQLTGANANPTILAQNQLPSTSNYFLGSDPSQWYTDVANYGSVEYDNIYSGINLVYSSVSSNDFEYSFVVQPGASVSQIQQTWQGVTSASIDSNGNLVLQTPGGPVVQQAPTVYQLDASGNKVPVSVTQLVTNGNQTSFQVGAYDPSQPLIIDPSLGYSSYLGGSSGTSQGNAIAVDGAGNVYVAGSTSASNFPTQSGLQSFVPTTDSFITKFNSSGGLMYSTFLGGSTATINFDTANGIAVDSAGDAYVTGQTSSTNFPTTPGALQSTGTTAGAGFVSKLNATGDALLASTYFGSIDAVNAVTLDANGNAFIAGTVDSTGRIPTTSGVFQSSYGGGSQDAFLAKLNPTLSGAVYSSYLGGSGQDFCFYSTGVAVDTGGNAYVIGSTVSTNFPTTAGALQTKPGNPGSVTAFVTKVNPTGSSLVYSTYLGGSTSEGGNGIALDRSGDAFVTGSTTSSNFPTTAGAFQTAKGGSGSNANAFVSELNAAGSALIYSSYLGGSGGGLLGDVGYAIALDTAGDAFVVGQTSSSNFPTTVGAFQSSFGGRGTRFGFGDAFISKVNATGSTLVYSSYLGGSGDDVGYGVAVDPLANAYVTGWTDSTNFPTVNAFQSSAPYFGSLNAFVAKVLPGPTPPVFTGITPDTGQFSNDQLTDNQHLHLLGTAPPGATVTLYQAGVGQIGTTVANATTGTWSYDDSGTTLPEGVSAFTATDTAGGVTSPSSKDFLVTVDLTPPTVHVSVPATTTSLGPQVRVTASDLNGLSPTVTLDVGGTSNYATGTFSDGVALITLPKLSGLGTYSLVAHVTDKAGNQTTTATMTFQVISVSNPWVPTNPIAVDNPDPATGSALQLLGNVQVSQPINLTSGSDSGCGCSNPGGSAALVYNSDSTGVQPIVQVTLPSSNTAALPSTVTGTLTWDVGLSSQTVTTMTWNTTGATQGDVLTLATPVSTAVTVTGYHQWQLQLATPAGTQLVTSTSLVLSEDSTPFGSGWTFAPVDQLVSVSALGSQPAGVLREYGSGGFRFYASNGSGGYISPASDNGTLTLASGTYTYQTPDGQQWIFNSSGYEINWKSGDGLSLLTFSYNGSNQLTKMTAVDGTLSTFTYASGLLSTIKTVNSRTTSLAYSGTNLTQITNPDAGTHTFSYDSNHHLTGETFANLHNEWSYSSGGVVGTLTWGSVTGPGGQSNSSVSSLTPVVTQGLAPAGGTGKVAVGASALLKNPDGHTSTWQLDSQGRPLQTLAADGGVTTDAYSNGFLTSETDADGRTTTYALDSLDYVTQETLPDGNTISLQYQTAFHALTTYTDERGNTTTFAYDSQGHPTSETDAAGETTKYTYTSNGLLSTVTDPLNHITTYTYDGKRRLTQVKDALSKLTTYTYDANGYLLTTKDALSHVTTTNYDVMGRLTKVTDAVGNVMSITYNAAGLELSETDPNGNVTSLVYDGFGRGQLVSTIQGYGSPVQSDDLTTYDNAGNAISYRNADGWMTTQSYDPVGRLLATTDGDSGVMSEVYDAAGQLVQSSDQLGNYSKQAYNARGWVTTSTDALGEVTTYAYDQAGDLTSVTDPASHTTTTLYDNVNRATVQIDALGNRTTVTYDKAGNVSSVTDANNHVTSYVYDADNRLTKETDAVGTSVARTLTFAYDSVGNQTSMTDALGHTRTTSFDQDNRVTAVTDALGHTTTSVYDAAGNLTTSIDALSNRTTYVYNALNQQVAVIDPLGHTTTSLLDGVGQQVGTIDANGNVTRYLFDPAGRQTATVDALGGVDQTQYDAAGNVMAVIDAVGNQTNYLYDALNRVTKSIDSLGDVTTTVYNSAGLVSSVTDADNRTITYSYDADNRETSETWKSSTGSVVNTLTYSYDNVGNLLTAANNQGTYTLGYDALNRTTTQTDPWGLTLTYSYDAADRLTQVQDSKGGLLTSVYDNADRLTARKLTAGGQTLMLDPGYNNRNDLTSLTRFADLAGSTVLGTTVYGYDNTDRVTSIVNQNGSSATLSYYNYTYDNANRVTSESWNSQVGTFVYNGTHSYAYDATNQLTQDQTGTYNHTYSYDLNGNRTMSGYQTGTDNRLTTDGTWTYTYDNVGDLTQKTNGTGTTWTYSYDNLNHLTSATETISGVTTLVVNYAYDVFGNLLQEQHWTGSTNTTVTVRHAYDGTKIWADVDTSSNVLSRYVYGDDGTLWARMVPSGQMNAGVAWYFTDLLGSVTDLMDSTQSVKDHIDYDAYGNIVTEANASFGDAYKYDGGRFDNATGLVQFGWRWYNPATGTWIEQDPIQFAGGNPDLYGYVHNDPTNYTDPTGLIAGRAFTEKDIENAVKEMKDKGLNEDQIKLRRAILENVRNSITRFPNKTNPDWRPENYWEIKNGAYVPKEGMAVKAIQSLWDKTLRDEKDKEKSPRIGCYKYSKLIILKSYIDVAGGNKEVLNRIGQALNGNNLPGDLKNGGFGFIWEEKYEKNGFQLKQLLPGDQIYFKNPYQKLFFDELKNLGGVDKVPNEKLREQIQGRMKNDSYRGEEGSNVFYLGSGLVVSIYNPQVFAIAQYQQHLKEDWATPQDYSALTKKPIDPTTFIITQDNRPLPNPFTK